MMIIIPLTLIILTVLKMIVKGILNFSFQTLLLGRHSTDNIHQEDDKDDNYFYNLLKLRLILTSELSENEDTRHCRLEREVAAFRGAFYAEAQFCAEIPEISDTTGVPGRWGLPHCAEMFAAGSFPQISSLHIALNEKRCKNDGG